MTAIVVDAAERRYKDLLKKIAEQRTSAEADNLIRYHVTGAMVDDLIGSQETRRYGTRTVDNLAEDLKAMPEFSDMVDVKRFLYWSHALHKAWTTEDLQEMAKVGFTVSHAKVLLALSDKVRPAVEKRMLAGGRVVSTRVLGDVVREVCREKLTTEEAAATGPKAPDEAAPAVEEPSAVLHETPAPSAPMKLTAPAPVPAPKPEKKEKEKSAPTEKAVTTPSEPASPLKALKGADNLLTKLMSLLPDVFIAVRETGKRGFDSDKAQKNYEKLLATVSAGLRDLSGPMEELRKEIDDQRGTGD